MNAKQAVAGIILILAVCLMSILVSAPETSVTKDYAADNDYGKITLSESGHVISEYELYSNSNHCEQGVYCYYEITVSLKEPGMLVSGIEFKGNKKPVLSPKNYIITMHNVSHDVNDYKEVCGQNGTIVSCHNEITGTHKEWKEERVLTAYNGEILPAGNYALRGEAVKDYSDYVDWVISVNGVKFTEWYPWLPGDLAYDAQPVYLLDGNSSDSSGYGVNGIDTLISITTGKINQGYNFGVGGWVKLNDASIFDWGTGNFTISFWTKGNASAGARDFVMGTAGGNSFWLKRGSCTDVTKAILFGVTQNRCFNEAGGGQITIFNNSWHHIVAMRSSGNLYMYIDGIVTAESPQADNGNMNVNYMALGNDWSGSGEDLKADMDEVYFWNRSLSTEEITTLFNAGTGLQYPFTINYAPTAAIYPITPLTAYVNTSLTCNYTINDANAGDTLYANVSWYRNNVLYWQFQESVINGVESGNVLNWQNLSQADVSWNCSVTGYDGTAYSAGNSTLRLISNYAPVLNQFPNITLEKNFGAYVINLSGYVSDLGENWFNYTWVSTNASVVNITMANKTGILTLLSNFNVLGSTDFTLTAYDMNFTASNAISITISVIFTGTYSPESTPEAIWQGLLFFAWLALLIFSIWIIKAGFSSGSIIIVILGIVMGYFIIDNIPPLVTAAISNDSIIRGCIAVFFLVLLLLMFKKTKGNGSDV